MRLNRDDSALGHRAGGPSSPFVRVADLGEFGLLDALGVARASLPDGWTGSGDDAAVLPLGATTLLFTIDALLEGVHFEISTTGADDLGYKAGRYRVFAEDGSLVDRGKYIEIWTKKDGNWVLHRDIWNSSVQPEVESDHEE